jgi:transposase
MGVIGLDVSRTFAKIAYLEGRSVRAGGRVELQKSALDAFAQRLRRTDKVVLEATANYQPPEH